MFSSVRKTLSVATRANSVLLMMSSRTSASTTGVVARRRYASTLSDQQIKEYTEKGFVACESILSQSEIDDLIKWTNEVQDWPEQKGKWMKYYEETQDGERILCRVENFLDYHPQLNNMLTTEFSKLCSQLLGEDAVLFKEKINFKLPGGDGFKDHQDTPAWKGWDAKNFVSVLVAVDDATESNGCMWMVEGVHDREYPHTFPEGKIEAEYSKDWEWKPLPVKAGSIVFFDGLTPHKSFPNTTNKSRRAYYVTYNPQSEGEFRSEYYAEKRKLFPPEIEREPGVDYSKIGAQFNLGNPVAGTKGDE